MEEVLHIASLCRKSDTHISCFTHGFTAIQKRPHKTAACPFEFPQTLGAQEGNTTQKLKCDQYHTQRKKSNTAKSHQTQQQQKGSH